MLASVVRPRAAYLAAKAESLPAVATQYNVDPGPPMIRMWVDRARFQPSPAAVERLLPVEVGELNRLYQLGFGAWLPSSTIAEGVYFGIRVNGRLVSAAGTHVVSRNARLAVVGNVLTHGDHRGRGYAKAVTSAVTAELLRFCDQVVLNVRSDNPPAHRRLPAPRLRRALPLRGAADPADRLALGGPHRAAPAPLRRGSSGKAATPTPANRRVSMPAAHRQRPGPSHRAVARRPPRGTPMTDTATHVPHDVTDLALAAGGRPPHRVGGARDARPAPDPRALRARAAARRPAHRRLPPRHHRDGQPDADPQGRRRGRRTSRPRTRCPRRT